MLARADAVCGEIYQLPRAAHLQVKPFLTTLQGVHACMRLPKRACVRGQQGSVVLNQQLQV
jgi:hypothetical protein